MNKGLNVSVTSSQLGACVAGRNLKEAATNAPEDFKLIFSVLLLIAPKRGFDLFLDSDCTIGAGLGGSSAMCVAIVQSFNALRQNKWSKSEVADIAFQAERLSAVIEGGWQDQYSVAYGGLNFIEFSKQKPMSSFETCAKYLWSSRTA